MIIPVKWRQVTPNFRVVLPTGRIVVCLWVNSGVALLRDDRGDTRPLQVDPEAIVPMVVGEAEQAVASLAARFLDVEFVRSL